MYESFITMRSFEARVGEVSASGIEVTRVITYLGSIIRTTSFLMSSRDRHRCIHHLDLVLDKLESHRYFPDFPTSSRSRVRY